MCPTFGGCSTVQKASPECLEGLFSEVRGYGVLRSSTLYMRSSHSLGPSSPRVGRLAALVLDHGGDHRYGCHRSGLRQDGDAVVEGGSGEARVLPLLPHG